MVDVNKIIRDILVSIEFRGRHRLFFITLMKNKNCPLSAIMKIRQRQVLL